jgi:hypothetical protein
MSYSTNALNIELPTSCVRRASIANCTSVLTDIYHEDVNIAVWQNSLPNDLSSNIATLMLDKSRLNIKVSVTPNTVSEELYSYAPQLKEQGGFCQYIALLVDMFCTLLELKKVGLRLVKLDSAMCPKFHVDKIPCRLVTTFSGVATQWLPHDCVDRTKLGVGSQGLSDETSGVMQHSSNIQHLAVGDVALLKGEGWYNNENYGLVHRSPAVASNEQRLLLTLDCID